VNVDGVEAYAFATVDETALRADTPGAGLPRAPALQNAAHADDEFFLVPAIVK
jgi:aspartyl/glutamyl-tRNA(Asn/Gln) amidotransferase C subunit